VIHDTLTKGFVVRSLTTNNILFSDSADPLLFAYDSSLFALVDYMSNPSYKSFLELDTGRNTKGFTLVEVASDWT